MRNVIIWYRFIKNLVGTWRRCDVITSHRRQYDVMCLLGICPPPLGPPNILNLGPQYSKPSYAYAQGFHCLVFSQEHHLWNSKLDLPKDYFIYCNPVIVISLFSYGTVLTHQLKSVGAWVRSSNLDRQSFLIVSSMYEHILVTPKNNTVETQWLEHWWLRCFELVFESVPWKKSHGCRFGII